ncbi:UDP-N-acetylglucosamine 2-epimerase (non-hydrolyzing) [Fulvivirga sp. 29W222]|uniref:UDP-N-acetylglucosamine 2-epimerase (non-hydrolyzing) n=1 Tax=Fulvivirga marina TaxID=2494733 RepID=A0A937FVL6_9BACT|nr:UDP-N-acetylglucosamine 2-epimerase (non-hydrolyzing) [Fulvivirga marina]MBL6446864.1 UDP-N-acetylglucosamine 2-epimerase (non-hydrolyzing) [Fulvivirga marina]
MNILIIIGTRPEAIKLTPLYKALKAEKNVKVHLLSTGQHKELIEPIWELFDVKPDISLNVLSGNQSLSSLTSHLLNQINEVVEREKYDYIIVQGDTTSCMVGSLVAFYNRIKVAHVEAGLRTFNKYSPYPEEINRKITSVIADIHFSPTESARQNLINEKVQGEIIVTGNTGIDATLSMLEVITANKVRFNQKFPFLFSNEGKKMILITGHRRENIGTQFSEIFAAIKELSIENSDLIFVFPVHLNPNVRKQVSEWLEGISNIYLIDPVRYDEMIFLMDSCYLIMTDSGGIQEEAPSLNKPLLILRDTTERPEGVAACCSVLAGVKKSSIKEAFYAIHNNQKTYMRMARAINPYGDGKAVRRIVEHLLK